jgi:hypothetical protein
MTTEIRTIIDLNVRRYRDLLKSETDPVKRRTIANLLAEEEVMLADLLSEESKISPQRTRANGAAQ